MTGTRNPAALARSIIDASLYLTLGTADADGRPWAAPVYYAAASYSEFLWISSPGATHSRNIAARADVSIVIFDSRAPAGTGEAVYAAARAEQVVDGEGFERALAAYNGRFADPAAHGVRRLSRAELSGAAGMRLYRAVAHEISVLEPGGPDVRIPVAI